MIAFAQTEHTSAKEKKPWRYEYMGAHRADGGYLLRVLAPAADQVFLVGDFNAWSEDDPMRRTEGGIWEIFVTSERLSPLGRYKYKIYSGDNAHYKADPYARRTLPPPETASAIPEKGEYRWRDDGWLEYRRGYAQELHRLPMNVYELHLGSWLRGEEGRALSYGDIATELIPYVKQMGYTHVEIMPICEYPSEDSWGYQTCSYFAPTARYGSPDDFRLFVDRMHEGGVGVILDVNIAHFPKDEHGLYRFDTSPLYEYELLQECESTQWGTVEFDIGRDEVRQLLLSCLIFWAKEYHIDAFRIDAVAQIMSRDAQRGRDFFRYINQAFKHEFPDVLLIAEDSGALPGVTHEDGLCFDLKWNMGWAHDVLTYASLTPEQRERSHTLLNFSLMYAFDESFVIPISHDEVSGGKRSFVGRMWGNYSEKFACARTTYGYMMTHPGKKLLFMGTEIGQFTEWSPRTPVDWQLLEQEAHTSFARYISELNRFYLRLPQLWRCDDTQRGFEWLDADDSEHEVLTFVRRDDDENELLVAINFSPNDYTSYKLKGRAADYTVLFSSDEQRFGGAGDVCCEDRFISNLREGSVHIHLPPFAMIILRPGAKNTDISIP